MKCIYSSAQENHYPKNYLVNGIPQANPESPERIGMLLEGVRAAGLTLESPPAYTREHLLRTHPERYLKFLETVAERWQRIPNAADEVTPNIHPDTRSGGYPKSVVAQAGFHMLDASCPITSDTWNSCVWSAWSAVHAAEQVIAGDASCYGLCRPPGHHAGPEVAGGFCYLNNTAIAAEHLRTKFARVAVLDVDLHHGNGTQMCFYDRADVLTVSLHAHPERFYPFFWGYADEDGEGDGVGFNKNFPLPRGTGDEVYLESLDKAITEVEAFAPDALVIALGLDGFEGDPIAGLSITTKGFYEIGNMIAKRLVMPTVIIQEGGYPCEELGQNLASFVKGFDCQVR